MSEYHHGDTVTLTPPGYLGSGDLEVRTSLYDVECFGAVVKHPDNTDFNLGYFRLYYYTENRPNIPDFTAIERLSIELTTGDCSLEETSVDIAASSSVGDGARLIAVDVRNSGDDPIQVTSVSVSPATSIWDVFPLQPSLCSALGFSFCPASGFDETLEHGEETTLYVVLSNRVGSDATLTLNARTATECAPISCTEEVLVRSGSITSCEIDGPPGGLVGQNTITRFGVTCYDGMGTEIACVGDDWSLVSLTGEIMESDNEHAILYVDSRIGSSGRIRYTSGMANCDYRATIIDPLYDCYFDPSVADLDYGESEDFDLICTRGDRASTPDDHVDYSLGDGLTGDLTDESSSGVTYTAPYEDTDGDLHAYVYWDVSEDAYDLGTHTSAYIEVRDAGDVGGAVCEFEPPSVTLDWRESQSFTFTCSIDGEETIPDGVNYTLIGGLLGGLNEAGLDGLTYTAPSVNTSGRLRGYAYWGTVASPTVTGTAFADINVYNFSGYPDDVDDNETEDHPTDYDPPFEGATPACTIGDGPLTIYHGYYGWLSIRCGIDANEDCEFVEWTAEGAEIRESDRESDVDGTSFIVTGIYGSTGRIIADVGEDGTCYLPFEVSERACWEIS